MVSKRLLPEKLICGANFDQRQGLVNGHAPNNAYILRSELFRTNGSSSFLPRPKPNQLSRLLIVWFLLVARFSLLMVHPYSSSKPFGIDRGPFGTVRFGRHGQFQVLQEWLEFSGHSSRGMALLLGYDRGIGSGSTSPSARRIGGRPTSAMGPMPPMTREKKIAGFS